MRLTREEIDEEIKKYEEKVRSLGASLYRAKDRLACLKKMMEIEWDEQKQRALYQATKRRIFGANSGRSGASKKAIQTNT